MCGPDHTPPEKRYVTHESIEKMMAEDEYVQEEFPVKFKTADGTPYTYNSVICYKKGAERKPLVMVFPNYAGLKQFDKDQAMFLAKLGYVGLAVDLYQETAEYSFADRNPTVEMADGGKPATGEYVNMHDVKLMEYWMAASQPDFDPEKTPITVGQAQGMAHFQQAFVHYQGCLKEKGHWRDLMKLNLDLAKAHPAVHPDLAAGIGYCFGGQCLLELVRMGADVQGVVSFHGLLQSEPENMLKAEDWDGTVNMDGVANNYNKGTKILIENAQHDDHVSPESITKFMAEMDEQGVDWQIHHHSGAKHGWALPPGVWATEYDEKVDRRSTNNMIQLFREIFPDHPPTPTRFNGAGSTINVAVDIRMLAEPDAADSGGGAAATTTTTTTTIAEGAAVKTITTTVADPGL